MKQLLKKIIQVQNHFAVIFIAFGLILLCACSKNFEEYNTNPTQLSGPQTVSISSTVFSNIEGNLYSNYQTAFDLSGNVFAGYAMPGDPYGKQNILNYFMNDGWISSGWTGAYNAYTGGVLGEVYKLAQGGMRTSRRDLWAIALLLQIEAAHQLTDEFGPIPYTKAGSSVTSIPYDSQQTIYNAFFLQLDTAITNMNAFIAAGQPYPSLGAIDLIYGGSYTQWIKFANSMRLRLAMRIVRADSATARIQAQKALSDPGGLLENAGDGAAIGMAGATNPIYTDATYYTGADGINASLICYQNGFHDPRQPVCVLPAINAPFTGQYIGLRQGATYSSDFSYISIGLANYNYAITTPYTMAPPFGNITPFSRSAPYLLMTAAEVWFLRAEAALRGWLPSETVQNDYNSGITTSMLQWGITDQTTINNYINNDTSTESPYIDPLNPANNSTPADLSTITIKWDPSASQERMLERIITQKWMAMFPDGQQGWSDFRRTGYPKLFTPLVCLDPSINPAIQIRRLPYPKNEYTTNNAAVNLAVSKLLGGPDKPGTRVWWDNPNHLANF
jgi:SusD/RagB-like outer membrane lipoprotein